MASNFLTVNDYSISWGQALRYLETSEKLSDFVGDVLRQHVLEQELQTRQIEISDGELDRAIQDFLQDNDLNQPDSFKVWLESQGLEQADFKHRIALQLRVEALKKQIAQPKLREFFIERKLFLDQVVLSQIAVADVDLAEELFNQIVEGARFEQLAREYSLSKESISNGMMGAVSRGAMPDVLRAAVDVSQEEALVGPFKVGDRWRIFRVEKFLPAAFDDPQVQQQLQDELFEQWLVQTVQRMDVQLQIDEE